MDEYLTIVQFNMWNFSKSCTVCYLNTLAQKYFWIGGDVCIFIWQFRCGKIWEAASRVFFSFFFRQIVLFQMIRNLNSLRCFFRAVCIVEYSTPIGYLSLFNGVYLQSRAHLSVWDEQPSDLAWLGFRGACLLHHIVCGILRLFPFPLVTALSPLNAFTYTCI